MTLNMVCAPGRNVTASMVLVQDRPALMIYLDPANLAIQVPPFPGGSAKLAQFCRELAREAVKLADHLDQGGGRHTLRGEEG